MAANARKFWILAYDIRDPRRLRRIHGYLRERGQPLQYSVFGLELTDAGIRKILDDLSILMNPDVDDIRAYHLPEHCQVWTLGAQALPDGVELHATQAMRLLQHNSKGSASRTEQTSPDPFATLRNARENDEMESGHIPRPRGD